MTRKREKRRLLLPGHFTEGVKSRAEAATYFIDLFVVRRLNTLGKGTDVSAVQEIFDALLAKGGTFPVAAWLGPVATTSSTPAASTDAPDSPNTAQAPSDPSPHTQEEPGAAAILIPPADTREPAQAAEELLSSMSLADAIHAETARIYDLCKQRDDFQEQLDVLQARIHAKKAEADAADTAAKLQEALKAKETDIQRHRSIRMVLQEKEAAGHS